MNKMYYCKKAILIPAVITIMVAGGCSSDDDNDEMPSGAVALKFQVSETPLETPEAPTASTRTKETTTASFSSFYYHFVVSGNLSSFVSAIKDPNDGLWTSEYGWPSADDNTSVPFYAYANADHNSSVYSESNKVYLNFTVDQNTYETKDFLVATAKDTKSHSKGVIGFQFSHACGALRFSLNKTSSLSDYTVMVNTVKICNIPCSGTYCFNDKSWALDTNPTLMEFTIKSYEDNDYLTVTTEKPDKTDRTYLSNEDDYLFLIPQTLTPWNKTAPLANAYVKIKCKIYKDGDDKVGSATEWDYAYLPLNINIAQGMINPVHISMGTALRDSIGNKYFDLTN